MVLRKHQSGFGKLRWIIRRLPRPLVVGTGGAMLRYQLKQNIIGGAEHYYRTKADAEAGKRALLRKQRKAK